VRERRIEMCRGPIVPNMIRYVIPVFFVGLVQRGFQMVDSILAGQIGTSGSDAVTAVGATTALTSLMINFFIGCSTGSAVTVSHAVGSGDKTAIQKTVHTAMLLSVVLGSVLTVLGLLFSKTVLIMMSTPEEIIELAATYLRTYFLGMIPYMVYNFGAAILNTIGENKKPLYYLLISGPVKVLLTVLFVSGFQMDVAGLALATTLSQIVSAVLVIASLVKRTDSCKLRLSELKFSAKPLGKILALGIPSGVQSATFSLSNVLIQSSVNSLSDLNGFVTGNAAACSIEGVAEVTTATFYQMALNFTGQNVGAHRYDRVKKVFTWSLGLSCLAVLILSPTVVLLGRPLLGLYIKDSEEAIQWGMVRITFIFIPLIFQALMDTVCGAIRGMGVSTSSMIICLLGICGIRSAWLITVFQLPAYRTPQVLYSIYPISWILTTGALLVLYRHIYKKQTRQLMKNA